MREPGRPISPRRALSGAYLQYRNFLISMVPTFLERMCVASVFSGRTSMRMAKLLAGCCVAVLALSGATAWAADVTPDRLLNAGKDAEAGNWLMVGKTYDS